MNKRVAAAAAIATVAAIGLSFLARTDETRGPSAMCRWLAGDLDVHTVHTFTRLDRSLSTESALAFALGVGEQGALAAERDLDFIAITDYDSVAGLSDPEFGTEGLIWIPGYEEPFPGVAQVLGMRENLAADGPPLQAIASVADQVRAKGGIIQVGHPGEGWWPRVVGTSLRPDAVEVWFNGPWGYDPGRVGKDQTATIRFYDRLLDRGYQVAATGGSNSQHRGITKLAGAGQPTTYVCAEEATVSGVLGAISAGRTSISHEFPSQGPLTDTDGSSPRDAAQTPDATSLQGVLNPSPDTQNPFVTLEADDDGDGRSESMIGDRVRPGAVVKVGILNAPFSVLRLVTDRSTVLDQVEIFTPAFVHEFEVPRDATWIRAELFANPEDTAGGPCRLSPRRATYCGDRIGMLAITSPLYVDERSDS